MGVGDDAETKGWLVTFNQRLEQLGWHVGRNLQIDERWTDGDPERNRRFAGEILAMQPDAIFAFSSVAVAALQHENRSAPIVFTAISDPVGSGFVQSLAARPPPRANDRLTPSQTSPPMRYFGRAGKRAHGSGKRRTPVARFSSQRYRRHPPAARSVTRTRLEDWHRLHVDCARTAHRYILQLERRYGTSQAGPRGPRKGSIGSIHQC
jgi:hypothetical protein